MSDLAPQGEFVLFQAADGSTRIECRFESDTLWLTQALIAELYQKDVRTINEHLQNIYKEAEIDQNATIRNFRIVREEGSRQVSRNIDHYNLEAILAVGYRVRSTQGTQFRKWATEEELVTTGKKAKAWRIDLVLFVNGLPVATLELKSEFKQAVQNAITQYKTTRPPIDPETKEPEPHRSNLRCRYWQNRRPSLDSLKNKVTQGSK